MSCLVQLCKCLENNPDSVFYLETDAKELRKINFGVVEFEKKKKGL